MKATGTYVTTSTAGESVRAFVPNPLPPDPPLRLADQDQDLIEKANRALGRLDGITTLLPDVSLFLYFYVRKEAVLSSQIEGTQSSFSDLLLHEEDLAPGVPLADVQEVSNYVAAMNHGLKRLREDNFPLSLRLIREVHQVLLAKGRGSDKTPGEFRRSQNWLGGTRPGNARFVPPPPERVAACMDNLERVPSRSAPAHARADQGGAGPRPIRDDPPLPGWQRQARPPAGHVDPLCPGRPDPAAAVPQLILQAASPGVLRPPRCRAPQRRLARLASFLSGRGPADRPAGNGHGRTNSATI